MWTVQAFFTHKISFVWLIVLPHELRRQLRGRIFSEFSHALILVLFYFKRFETEKNCFDLDSRASAFLLELEWFQNKIPVYWLHIWAQKLLSKSKRMECCALRTLTNSETNFHLKRLFDFCLDWLGINSLDSWSWCHFFIRLIFFSLVNPFRIKPSRPGVTSELELYGSSKYLHC